MATSGSVDFELTRDRLIKRALQVINVLDANEDLGNNERDLANDLLDMMIKDWEYKGIYLWKQQDATVFLANNAASYTLGSSGDEASETVSETTLDAAEASGQTVLSVTSTSGFTNGDNIGIELDDDTLQWTTISSFVTNDTVTIGASLTSAAASGNNVYAFTTLLLRPLAIAEARFRDDSGNDRRLEPYSQDEYRNIYNKTQLGDPNVFFYHIDRLSSGKLFLWPVPNKVEGRIKITYVKPFEDMDGGSDNFDFPQDWQLTLTYSLAALLAPIYGKTELAASVNLKARELLFEKQTQNERNTNYAILLDV